MAKVSVIVPIYNVEAYLNKCINSILEQSFSDIQVVLVDDGSTDLSGEICDRFALKDNRILVRHQQNLGLVEARKTGLNVANADFICWVDGDDWVEKDYVSSLWNESQSHNSDLVVSEILFDIGNSSSLVKSGLEVSTYNVNDIKDKFIYNGKFFEYGIIPHLPSKLFKKAIILDAISDVDHDITIGEDAIVTYSYITKIDSVSIINYMGYHYVQHEESMTKRTKLDIIYRLSLLLGQMQKKIEFSKDPTIYKQLIQYEKYLLLLHKYEETETRKDYILHAFGGINVGSKIVLYGAGGMGISIERYLSSINNTPVAWIDKNFKYYEAKGKPVQSLDYLYNLNDNRYDYVIIANTNSTTAESIRNQLISAGIRADKIRWLDDDWLDVTNKCSVLL